MNYVFNLTTWTKPLDREHTWRLCASVASYIQVKMIVLCVACVLSLPLLHIASFKNIVANCVRLIRNMRKTTITTTSLKKPSDHKSPSELPALVFAWATFS